MSQIIICIFVIFVSVLGSYLYFRPKLIITAKLNEEIQKENEELDLENRLLKNDYKALNAAIEENQKTAQFWTDYLVESQEKALKSSKTYKEECMKVAEEELKTEIDKLQKDYENAEKDYQKEYLQALEDATSEYSLKVVEKQDELNDLQWQIDNEQSKVTAFIEAAKRQYEIEHTKDFYRLCLSKTDIDEVCELRKIIPHLRNAEPLNKVIWKMYYEKPYTDLVGRVIGSGIHTGIYKITNIDNQMCYVGQAANIAERWKTHIKRGLGAETPINNKLYPAMILYGVENFTFEIIEECDRSKLNEREDYWQEVFKAKEFGYSIK